MYQRLETTDGKTVMNKALYDNLQDGIDENKKSISDLSGNLKATNIPIEDTSNNFENDNIEGALQELIQKIATALINANSYTDGKISALINGSPTTLDTLKELADAIGENEDLITALNSAIGNKAEKNHTHNYAGSSSAGGDANNALLLGNNVMDINCGGSEGDALYRKILTLSTNIKTGENGFIAIVSGGTNFGDNTNVGFGILEMTTRGDNLVPKYTQLTLSNIKFGYVNNENGTTSIWLLKGSYCHPIHMLVTMKSEITINNDSETTIAPPGLTYGTINTFIDSNNYKNIVTPANIGAIAISASCNKNWNWYGYEGQPQWLWGGDDGTNMYVYNPSNFNVNYANTTHALRTYDANGISHGGTGWLLNCQHNVDGDGLFKIFVGDKGIGTKVDRASWANGANASNVTIADTAGYFSANNAEGALAEIWAAVKYPNQTIMGAVNWNNYMVTGIYKIQNCTMTSTYNAPVGVYAFGILVVIHPEQGGENRCLQIYVPHNSEGMYFARMYNNTTWNDWKSSINHTHSYLPLSGGTLTGQLNLTEDVGIQGTTGTNDYWRIKGISGGDNAGTLEIATADDGTEPIYFRQYSGAFSTIIRTLTLLDGSGNTSLPGNLTVSGTLTGSKVYNATWGADYAEAFDFIGEKPEIGDIVEIYDERKLKKAEKISKKVVGVVSDSYCILAGCDENDVKNGNKIAIGLLGQLPIKIIGKVEAGDFITSVGNGIGKVADENVPRGSIIGRALESNSKEDIKMVYCLIQPQ